MLISLKVKTLDAKTHDFSVDDETTIREFKDKITEKTNIPPNQQRIIFCGRVLNDEKRLKDFDVDGKVIHVAERPPPVFPCTSALSSYPNTEVRLIDAAGRRSSSGLISTPLISGDRNRIAAGGMRSSPLFRALDGMVVGTMTIPFNGSNSRLVRVNPLTASSSFCMNRITVARHMLQCADNIAAYLEDPSRGLNNTSLDILANGRWTMESTVVEVGITGEIPQNQNFVDIVQGAVTAALTQNNNQNLTMLHMPTTVHNGDNNARTGTTARVFIQNITEDEEGNASVNTIAPLLSNTVNLDENPNPSANSNNNASSSTTNDEQSPLNAIVDDDSNDVNRRRTGTRIFAEVIEQMSNVQNRLNPFIEQFYDLLQNEPTFAENDNEGRTNAQRLFDRVSEAFHYMSHAQHALSDLMLDLSQPTPRYLTCRPILVDQSGYVSSNNVVTQTILPSTLRQHINSHQHNHYHPHQQNHSHPNNYTDNRRSWNTTPENATPTTVSVRAHSEPTDEAMTTSITPQVSASDVDNNNQRYRIVGNHLALSRLLEAMNYNHEVLQPWHRQTTIESNYQSEQQRNNNNNNINNNYIIVAASSTTTSVTDDFGTNHDNTSSTASATTSNTTTTSNETTINRARASTATFPTFSTQTRSTSRPQIASDTLAFTMPLIGSNGANRSSSILGRRGNTSCSNNNNASNSSNTSSNRNNGNRRSNDFMFDRFLPCNSRHVREFEQSNSTNNVRTNSNGNRVVAVGGNNSNANGNVVRFASASATPRTRNSIGINQSSQSLNRGGNTHRPRNNGGIMEAHAEVGDLGPLSNRMLPIQSLFSSLMSSGIRHAATLARRNNTIRYNNRSLMAPALRETYSGNNSVSSRNISSSLRTYIPNQNDDNDFEHNRLIIVDTNGTMRNAEEVGFELDPNVLNHRLFNGIERTANFINQLSNFIINCLFAGRPINNVTIPLAIERVLRWFDTTLVYIPHFERDGYDSRTSLINVVRCVLPQLIEFVRNIEQDQQEYRRKLHRICMMFRKRLYSVLYICIGDSRVHMCWKQLMRLLTLRLKRSCSGDMLRYLGVYLSPIIPCSTIDPEAQQHITHYSNYTSNTRTLNEIIETSDESTSTEPPLITPHQISLEMQDLYANQGNNEENNVTPQVSQPKNSRRSRNATESASKTTNTRDEHLSMGETDVEINDEEVSTSQPEPVVPSPTVIPGSETWHRHCPSEWLHIISRDMQRQNENNGCIQNPFSDAYISGMNAKRRKMIQNSKPPANINALISSGVNIAIQSVVGNGAASTSTVVRTGQTPAEIAESIANDTSVQNSYKEAVRDSIRERVQNDPNYIPEKYPKINELVKK